MKHVACGGKTSLPRDIWQNEHLQHEDLPQARLAEATWNYNSTMRNQMLPRKPLPHPELEPKRTQPLKNLKPGEENKHESAKFLHSVSLQFRDYVSR